MTCFFLGASVSSGCVRRTAWPDRAFVRKRSGETYRVILGRSNELGSGTSVELEGRVDGWGNGA